MRSKRKTLRFISIFLLLEMSSTILYPTVSLALTSGPTAPEATSFEPVDTTDVVNLNSGDFVYNIPLLEVPGPSGGYPLSLSYHAGVQPNEDASWVGLGWSLNPGAINRSQSGLPDDLSSSTGVNRTFWEGGESKSLSIGISIGQSGANSISAGLSYSEDTYRGVDQSFFVKFADNKNGNGVYLSSTGVSVGIGLGASGAVNIPVSGGSTPSFGNSNFDNLTSTVSGLENMDLSLSTVKTVVASRIGYRLQSLNSKSGNVTTSGYNFFATIPIKAYDLTIQLGKSYQRYWIDESELSILTGSLYTPQTRLTGTEIASRAFDNYDLPVILDYNNPKIELSDKYPGGTFADYDQYQVMAQGIGGSIRPYHYKSNLYRQTRKDTDGTTILTRSYGIMQNLKPTFRFEGDFSNRYDFTNLQFEPYTQQEPLGYNTTTPATLTGESGTDGYNAAKNKLAGSKHIEWYTNAQVLDRNGDPATNPAILDGFLNCIAPGFVRSANDQIGGFKIINDNGITYHFALPVYSFEEYSYSGRTDDKGKEYFNHYSKPEKYAYTWLLTAVTGPDFVDRNTNGYADQGDWGYWTSFEYGKWASDFGWRNPSEGFNKDIDQDFDFFSKGKKEVYYLNYIKTNTHTAVFVKELRPDGKGTTSLYKEARKNDNVDYLDAGGFDPINETIYPVSTLKLTEIHLLKNEDLKWDLPARSSIYNQSMGGTLFHQGKNIIDIHDISDIRSQIVNVSQRSIILNTDNSLCAKTANSFFSKLDVLNTSNSADALGVRRGKLTLTSIKTLGNSGADLLPTTKFIYDVVESPVVPSFNVTQSRRNVPEVVDINSSVPGYGSFKPNDLIKLTQNGNELYGIILYKTESSIYLQMTRNGSLALGPATNFQVTKNPCYQKDFYDMWGMYKSDYIAMDPNIRTSWGGAPIPENIGRMTTPLSAQSTDVWSLREIVTPLGAKIKIDYESDSYSNVLKSLTDYQIKDITVHDANAQQLKVTFYNNISNLAIASGALLPMATLFRRFGDSPWVVKAECNGTEMDKIYIWTPLNAQPNNPSATFISKGADYIIVHDTFLFTEVTRPVDEVIMIDPATYIPTSASSGLRYDFGASELVSGQLLLPNAMQSSYGGGIRVKAIKLESNGVIRETHYDYSNGVTSYEPLGFKLQASLIDADFSSCIKEKEKAIVSDFSSANYYKSVLGKFLSVIAASRELPSPGVLYGNVTVTERIYDTNNSTTIDLPGHTEYEYEVFTPDLVSVDGYNGVVALPVTPPVNQIIDGMNTKSVGGESAVIDDFSARIGNLRRMTFFNSDNQKMSETKLEYLHDQLTNENYKAKIKSDFKNQGVVRETFVDARFVRDTDAKYNLIGVVSQKNKYPSIQTAIEKHDYKTGIVSRSENKKFDFYSGQVTQSLSSDGYGNYYISETTPAYRQYSSMGLATLSGKNMLTQEAMAVSYKVMSAIDLTKVGVQSANVQTWTDKSVVETGTSSIVQPGIWRKHASFSFVGNDTDELRPDGFHKIEDFTPFNGWDFDANAPDRWLLSSRLKRYDMYSHGLEAVDMNDNYAATRMDRNQQRVIASVVNAKYKEFANSGAEYYAGNMDKEGDVSRGEGNPSSGHKHTGTYSLLVGVNKIGFNYTLSSPAADLTKKYRASVWVYAPGDAESQEDLDKIELFYSVNNQQVASVHPILQKNKSKSWYLLNLDIPPNSNSQVVIGVRNATQRGIYFDDFRVHPLNSVITSYVYDPFTGQVNYMLDSKNLYSRFEYDRMGRLIRSSKELLNFDFGQGKESYRADHVLSEMKYNFGKNN